MIICCNHLIEPQNESLKFWSDVATIFIAIANLGLTIFIFTIKNRKDDVEKEKDRKIELLKTLVLDHNLNKFYSFFDELDIELLKLKNSGLLDKEKANILENTDELFIELSRKFTDTLLAIDKSLYDSIMDCNDELQKTINDAVGNEGINLTFQPKFDEEITQKVTRHKTEILHKLFQYRG
jgi:hypothetical protein